MLGTVVGAAAAMAATYHVDNASPSCSVAGPGDSTTPYCSITAALAARGGPGTTIVVHPGTYREQVTLNASGQSGAPLVLQAQGTVVVDGADDYSSPALWTPVSGNVWIAAGVTWTPRQVFANGARLIDSALPPATLGAGTFRHVPGEGLYVNVGGGNPAAAGLRVGRRAYGFRATGRSWVTIQGFTVTRTEDRGIYFSTTSSSCSIVGNTVSFAFRPGIQVSSSTAMTIDSNSSSSHFDHGLSLSGVTASTIRNNHVFGNTSPTASASGIYASACSGNRFEGNRTHDNSVSGLYLISASNGNLSVQNRSWRNGRHGFEEGASTGNRHLGDVAWGNFEEGFSLNNGSTGAELRNCIASANLGRGLLVEAGSTAGFVSDDNLIWSAPGKPPVRYAGIDYASVAAYSAASGRDTRTLGADPRFVNPVGGDFRPDAGSPAIDAANSSIADWPATDAEGGARADDPAIPNSGIGPVPWADRGALERAVAAAVPPIARLVVTPGSGTAPLGVTADASASTAGSAPIASYRFDFGDGTGVGPQAAATATHAFAAGAWTVIVTVTDASGRADTAAVPVTATPPSVQGPEGVIELPSADVSVVAGHQLVLLGSGTSPGGALPLSYQWDLGGAAPNPSGASPGAIRLATPGTFTLTLRVRDATGAVDPTPPTRVIRVADPATLPADEIHWTVMGPTSISIDWRGAPTTVAYGPTPAYGQTATAVAPVPTPYSSPGPWREARLVGLNPDALYHYSVGGGPDHTFRTPPPRGTAGFSVMVEADVGESDTYDNMPVVQAMIAAERPDLVLVPGDLTYANDHGQPAVDRHFNDVMVWSQDAPYMPSWGNHEWDSAGDNLKNYKGRFDLPNPRTSPNSPVVSCCGEDWYWFDYGNVRFIAYPEPFVGAWASWVTSADSLMDEAQADPAIRFIVTFGHRPAYSSGNHAGAASLASSIGQLGAEHSKFVLNLNGHSHDYERTYPQSGVTHVTVGLGGASLETTGSGCLWEGGCPPPEWSAFRAYRHGTLRLRFGADGIVGEALCGPASVQPSNPNDITCEFGTVFDRFVIGNPDRAPVVTVPPLVPGVEGEPVTVAVAAIDPDGDAIAALTADLGNLPAGHGATFTPAPDRRSGTLSWSPGFADSGSYAVTFTAANALAGTSSTSIVIANRDRAPAVTVAPAVVVNERATLTLPVAVADPDGDPIVALTADLSALPASHGAVFVAAADRRSGTLTWTPGFADSGSYTVTFTGANAMTGSASTRVRVINVDRPPVVTAPVAIAGAENTPLTVTVTAADPDGDAIASLTATLGGLPSPAAVFAPASGNQAGTLSWTPSYQSAGGPYGVTFTAVNALSGSATTAITVANVDRAPIVTAPVRVTVAEGDEAAIGVSVVDPDGDAITGLAADLSGLPPDHGATFTPAAGNGSATLRWRTGFGDGGTYTVPFTATNGASGSASTIITVSNRDRAPAVTALPAVGGVEGTRITVTVTAADPDGEPITALTADLSAFPPGNDAHFVVLPGNGSGLLAWTPTYSDGPGSYPVTFVASNALTASTSTTITVAQRDRRPVVTVPASVVVGEGQPLTLTVLASDPDGEPIATLTADLVGLPAGHGAVFTPGAGNATGTLSWTPAAGDGEFSPYIVSFSAANALSGSNATAIVVDRPPRVTCPAETSVVVGETLSMAVTAMDPDGDPLTSIAADLGVLPAGQSVAFVPGAENASGVLTWAPSSAAVGTHVLRFTAANTLAGWAATRVTVRSSNHPPHAILSVEPASGVEPLQVRVDASGTQDPEGGLSYRFDFGDGATAGPGPDPIAVHSYAAGIWRLRVVVTDGEGARDSAETEVAVAQNLIGNSSFETSTSGWNVYSSSTIARVPGGDHGAWALEVKGPAGLITFGINDSPDWISRTAVAATRYRYTARMRSATATGRGRLQVREYLNGVQQGVTTLSTDVRLAPEWQTLTVDYVARATGSSLNFQVLDLPAVPGETFLVDYITLRMVAENVTAAAPLPPAGVATLAARVRPNPVRGEAVVALTLPRSGPVSIAVLDLGGRAIRPAVEIDQLAAGSYEIPLVGGREPRLPAGVYFFRVRTPHGITGGRFVVLE